MLDARRLARCLPSGSLWDIRTYDVLSSTNDAVKEALHSGAPQGLAITALEQRGGYGRQGRTWASPLGGLYVSLALRPDLSVDRLPSLSLVVSLAVRSALIEVIPEKDIAIKWPNDILCRACKVCGISLEVVDEGAVCVGIGINVFHPTVEPSRKGKYRFGYLSSLACGDVSISRADEHRVAPSGLSEFQLLELETLLISVLEKVESFYLCWRDGGFSIFRDDYESLLFGRGERIRLETVEGASLVEGTLRGVDLFGNLLVEDSRGAVTAHASGEVHVVAWSL